MEFRLKVAPLRDVIREVDLTGARRRFEKSNLTRAWSRLGQSMLGEPVRRRMGTSKLAERDENVDC